MDSADTRSREDIALKLKADIEALVEGRVMYSRSALTARLTQHTVICNGSFLGEEGTVRIAPSDPQDMADATLRFAEIMRRAISGPVDLVWRVEPRFEQDGKLYTRLCFEPVIQQVAPGVWVEQRLFDDYRKAHLDDYRKAHPYE